MATGDRIRKQSVPEAPFKKTTGRVSFPRRSTLDLTDEQHEWLKEMAWQNRESVLGLLRAIIDGLMADEVQLKRIIKKK